MTAKTHMAGGLLAGVLVSQQAGLELAEAAVVVGASVFGSLLPDIDTTQSKMGRALLPISVIVSTFVGHRKLTHSLLLWPILGAIMAAIFPAYHLQIIACVAGCVSHIVLDALTVEGVPVFYPIPMRVSFTRIHTGGMGDVGLGVLLTMISGAITSQIYF